MRLDLATDLRARIGAPDKDARLTNAFVEVKAGPLAAKNSAYPAKKETCVRKRPGCVTTGYDYTTPIQGIGGSLPYLIYDDTFSAFDAVPATSVLIGDLVGGYYAMVDDPPTSPGPGDDYWSVTPPDSRRYQAWSLWEVASIVDNDPDNWAAHAYTSASGSTNCFCTTRLAASVKAAARQALHYLLKACPGYSYQHAHTYTYLGGTVETYATNYVIYYPYEYIFTTAVVNPEDAVISIVNDTICTDVSYIYGVSTVCAYVSLNMKMSYSTGSPTAPDPVCAVAGDYYDAGLSIVRRV